MWIAPHKVAFNVAGVGAAFQLSEYFVKSTLTEATSDLQSRGFGGTSLCWEKGKGSLNLRLKTGLK